MNEKAQAWFSGKLVLITGAASGIGRATAYALAPMGARLILTDINEEALDRTRVLCEGLGATEVETYLVDVADLDDMTQFAKRVHRRHEAVDVLINNAGVGLGGDFLSTDIDAWHWIIGINVMGVVHGCKLFGEKMVARGQGGHIVNLASAAGYMASKEMPAYSATKFAVLGLSEALRGEMAGHGIGVSAICPGVINTGIIQNGRFIGMLGSAQEGINRIYRRRNYGPELVANAIIDAVINNVGVRPVSPEAWAMYAAKRFVPGVLDWMGRRQGSIVDALLK